MRLLRRFLRRFLRFFALAWSVAVLLVTGPQLAQVVHFWRAGKAMSARIVDRTNGLNPRLHEPILEYVVDGRVYRFTSHYATDHVQIGDTETVYYLPDQPDRAIDSEAAWFSVTFASGALVILGLAVFGGRLANIYQRKLNF